MTELTADAFASFFEEVYQHRPFAWQSRLTAEVLDEGWPDVLDLPTGTGKTAALDIALFALAVDRSMPRRSVFVVDRRIVVHQAAARVRRLVAALADPKGEATKAVANRLRALAPSPAGSAGDIVHLGELRGGIVRDERWATRPDVPAVLVSTVDQVGSRLLFRGYGVSRGMRPVHAGLLGSDTLYLLDEVHLARAFRSTLRSIETTHRRPESERWRDKRWQVVEMSATPVPSRESEGTPFREFRIAETDREAQHGRDVAACAELNRRLDAHKPVELREVKTTAKPAAFTKSMSDACIREVMALATTGVATIGVVVNRVATAVEISRRLDDARVERILVTGRMRPVDRSTIVTTLERRAGTGRVSGGHEARAAASRVTDNTLPFVVVATQAIEAGADLDLDAMVTECASLDALKQRFGRVDRTGAVSAAGTSPVSVVLGASSSLGDDDDPVYGKAVAATWRWLQEIAADRGVVDLGPLQLPEPDAARKATLLPPAVWTPQLLPGHLDRWVQTSIEPDADPLPAHWLHGLAERAEDISVVWRADITAGLLGRRNFDPGNDPRPETLNELLETCPVDSSETMSVPVPAVRNWLLGIAGSPVPKDLDPVSDTTVPARDTSLNERQPGMAPVVLLTQRDGLQAAVIDRAADLRPGSTIVVPCDYGGITAASWDPSSTELVEDRATVARAGADGRAVVRLVPGGLRSLPDIPGTPAPTDDDLDGTEVLASTDRPLVAAWLSAWREAALAHGLSGDVEYLVADHLLAQPEDKLAVTRQRTTLDGSSSTSAQQYFVVTTRALLPESVGGRQRSAPVDSEPQTSSFLGREVTLERHLGDVRSWAEALATNVGLSPELVADLALAGWLHDIGKADRRFQRLLRNGGLDDPERPLAKSATTPGDRRLRRHAEAASGYPRGARHELLSLALIDSDPTVLAAANEPDLVRHLVASHHGYCRPFAPVAPDRSPIHVEVAHDGSVLSASSDHDFADPAAGVSERFWMLTHKYGWWGLAWLEAILRLADHRASEAEQRPPADEETSDD